MMKKMLTVPAFVVPIVCQTVGLIMMAALKFTSPDGRLEPGVGWIVAHAVWLVGLMMFAIGLAGLLRLFGREVLAARVIVPAALLGTAALGVQMALDIVQAWPAGDAFASRLSDVAVVRLALYDIGPLFLPFGLLALIIALAVRRGITAVSVVGVVLSLMIFTASLVIGFNSLGALAIAALWVAVAPYWAAASASARSVSAGAAVARP